MVRRTNNDETEVASGLYSKLAVKEPERDDIMPDDEETSKALTLSEKMDIADLSDLQSAIVSLFPGGLGDNISNKLMVARISPDVFISALRLLVVEDIMSTPPDQPINVAATVMKYYILLSIGLDGKGRIDHIELAGASREAEDLEKLGRGIF